MRCVPKVKAACVLTSPTYCPAMGSYLTHQVCQIHRPNIVDQIRAWFPEMHFAWMDVARIMSQLSLTLESAHASEACKGSSTWCNKKNTCSGLCTGEDSLLGLAWHFIDHKKACEEIQHPKVSSAIARQRTEMCRRYRVHPLHRTSLPALGPRSWPSNIHRVHHLFLFDWEKLPPSGVPAPDQSPSARRALAEAAEMTNEMESDVLNDTSALLLPLTN